MAHGRPPWGWILCVDLQSYTNAPVGLNFLIAGYTYETGSVLVDPSLPVQNVKATVDSEVLAYSRIISCWGQSGSVALGVPSGSGRDRELWASLDGTYYTGGRTSVNGSLDNDLQRNSRWGNRMAIPLGCRALGCTDALPRRRGERAQAIEVTCSG